MRPIILIVLALLTVGTFTVAALLTFGPASEDLLSGDVAAAQPTPTSTPAPSTASPEAQCITALVYVALNHSHPAGVAGVTDASYGIGSEPDYRVSVEEPNLYGPNPTGWPYASPARNQPEQLLQENCSEFIDQNMLDSIEAGLSR